MIRRIILFLGILFVWFFAYRRYDKVAADQLLSKIKHFSFSSKSNINTPIVTSTGSENKNLSGVDINSGSESISSGTNEVVLEQILNKDTLTNSVSVPWLSGKVVVQDKPVETISAVPEKKPTPASSPKNLTESDKQQAEEFWSLFSQ